MYYGNNFAEDGQNVEDVWSNGFAAVYHFAELTGNYLDSTSNNNDSTSVDIDYEETSRRNNTDANGIGYYPKFNSNGAENVPSTQGDSIGVADSNSLDFGTNSFTIFMRMKSDVTNYDCDLTRKGSTGVAENSWWKMEWGDQVVNNRLHFLVRVNGTDRRLDYDVLTPDGNWHNAWGIRSTADTNLKLYLDGVLVKSGAGNNGSVSNSANVGIGSKDTLDDDFCDASLDEVRYINVERSADWIAAENLYFNGTFNTFGSEVTNNNNNAPIISVNPSDGPSAATTPTNVGSNVTFTITATDADSDNYYLAICKENSITANNNSAPTCGGGEWCISSLTNSGSEASCTYEAQSNDDESNVWYAFVCDHNSNSICSSSSQGSGDSGSPFKINHAPIFSSISSSPDLAGVGQSVTFSSIASDSDIDTTSDTVILYVCKSNDFNGTSCGDAGEWCHSSAETLNPNCSYEIQASDTLENYDYYGYIIDNHNFSSLSNPRNSSFSADVVAPTISNINPESGTLSQLPSSITLTLNENGYCRISVEDEAYSEMSADNDCLGDGTQSIICEAIDTGSTSSRVLYIACQDEVGNENTSSNNAGLFYSLSSESSSPSQIRQPVTWETKSVVDKIKDIFWQFIDLIKELNIKEEQIIFSPAEESAIQDPSPALSHELNIITTKDFGELDISFLPLKFRNYIHKFPEFASTLEKVGITKSEDLEKIKNVKFSFPGISDISGLSTLGLNTADFASFEKEKIPTDFVFARAADNKIDINMKLVLSDGQDAKQSFNIVRNRQISLIIKPEFPAENIKGVITLLPSSKTALNNILQSLSASILSSIDENKENKEKEILLDEFEYLDDDNDGIYTADVQLPNREGKYEINTKIVYQNKNIPEKDISVFAVVDPEGYIYENIAGKQARIKNAIVSIYWLNPNTKEYELWPAKEYHQENPIYTDETGKYSFLVPPGYYYLSVEAEGYSSYKSDPFQVSQGREINYNIQLYSKNWFTRIFSIEKILIAIIILLLVLISVVLFLLFKRKI